MWVVLKYKKSEFNFLKRDLKKALGNLPLIFRPKFKQQKLIRNRLHFIESDILGDYLICYHENFKNTKIFTILKNLKGLKYFLINSINSQKEIINFVDYCKKHQGTDGYLRQGFFNLSNIKKGIFLSGPFTNMLFNVIENQRKKLTILVGNVTATISKNTGYLYRSV